MFTKSSTAAQVRALSLDAVRRIKADEFNLLSLDALSGFTSEQIGYLEPAIFAMLTAERFALLTNNQGMGALVLRNVVSQNARTPIDLPAMGGKGITLQTRVKLLSKQQSSMTHIFDFGNGESIDNIILGFGPNGQLQAQTFNGFAKGSVVTSTTYVANTDWHTYTLTVTQSGTVTIYVDGVKVGSGQSSPLNDIARKSSFIGHSNSTANQYLNGEIEGFKAWDSALSANDVQSVLQGKGETIISGLPPLTVNAPGLKSISKDSFITLPTTQLGGNGLSLQARVKLTGAVPAMWARIFDLGNGEKSDNIILAFDGQGGLVAQTYNGSNLGAHITTTPLNLDGDWHTYTMTVTTGGFITLYVDNRQVGQGQSAAVRDTVRTSSFVGRSNWAQDGAPDIMADGVHIWDEVLNGEGLNAALGAPPNALIVPASAVHFVDLVQLAAGGYRLPTLQFGRQGVTLQARVQVVGNAPIWARIFDLGNGPESDNVFLAFDGKGGLIAGTNQDNHYGAYVTASLNVGNDWHTYTMTVKANGLIDIYVDGDLVGSGYSDPIKNITRGNNYVGHSNWSGDKDLVGNVQDVQVWNHALTGVDLRAVLEQAEPSASRFNPALMPVVALLPRQSVSSNKYIPLALPSMGALGISVQVRVKVDQTAAKWTRIFDFGNGPEKDNIFLAFDGNGGLLAGVFDGTLAGRLLEAPSSKFNAGNEWHTYTMTVSSRGFIEVYVDGTQVFEGHSGIATSYAQRININDVVRSQAYIGHSNWTSDPDLIGQVQDLRIWDHRLIADDLSAALAGIGYEDSTRSGTPMIDWNAKLITSREHYVPLPNLSPLGKVGVTLMARMQLNNGVPEMWARIFDLGNGPADNNIILAFDGKGGLIGQFFNDKSHTQEVRTGDLNLGTAWHTYAMTVDQHGTIAIYVDGAKVAGQRSSLTLQDVARTQSYIAHSNWSADPALNATLDGAQIWGRVLSETDIKKGLLTSTKEAAGGLHQTAEPIINLQNVVKTSSTNYLTMHMPTLGASGITLQARVKVDTTVGEWARIFDLGNGSENDNIILAFTGYGGLVATIYEGNQQGIRLFTDKALFHVDKDWHTYTMTVTQDGLITLWVDGNWVGSQNTEVKLKNIARNNSYVGHSNWASDPSLSAQIQDVEVWDKSLNDVDLATLLSQASSEVSSELEPTSSSALSYFAGSSYLQLAPLSGTTRLGANGVTLRARINLAGAAPKNMARIFDLGDGEVKDNIILAFDQQGRLAGQIFSGASAGAWVTSTNAFPLSGWHDVAMQVKTNGTITLYLDGHQVATGASGKTLSVVDRTQAFVGHSNWVQDPGIDAQIQNVQVWGSSDPSLVTIATVKGTEPDLVDYLPLTRDLSNPGSGRTTARLVDTQGASTNVLTTLLQFSANQLAKLPDSVLTGLTATELSRLDLSQLSGRQLALHAKDGTLIFNDLSSAALKNMVRNADTLWTVRHLDARLPADFDLYASLAQAIVVGPASEVTAIDAITTRLQMGGLIVDIRLSADKQKQVIYYALNKEGQLLDKIRLSFSSTDGNILSTAEDLAVAQTSAVNPDLMIASKSTQLALPLVTDAPAYVESLARTAVLDDGATYESITRRQGGSIETTTTDTAINGSKTVNVSRITGGTRQASALSEIRMVEVMIDGIVDQRTIENSVNVAADGVQIVMRKQTLVSDATSSDFEVVTISASGVRQYTNFTRRDTTPAAAVNYGFSADLRQVFKDNLLQSKADFSNTAIVKVISDQEKNGLSSVQKAYARDDRLMVENIIIKGKLVEQIQHSYDLQGVLFKTVDVHEKGVDISETKLDSQGGKTVTELHFLPDGNFSGSRYSAFDAYGRPLRVTVYGSSSSPAFSDDAVQSQDEWIYDTNKTPPTTGGGTSSAQPEGLLEYRHSDLTNGSSEIKRFDGHGQFIESITRADGKVVTHVKHLTKIDARSGVSFETWTDGITGMLQKSQQRDSAGRLTVEYSYDSTARLVLTTQYDYRSSDTNAPLSTLMVTNTLTQATTVTKYDYHPEMQLGNGVSLGALVDRPWIVKTATTTTSYPSNITVLGKSIEHSSTQTMEYDGLGRVISDKRKVGDTETMLSTAVFDDEGRLKTQTVNDPNAGTTTTTQYTYGSTPRTLFDAVAQTSNNASLKNLELGVQNTLVTVTNASGTLRQLKTETDAQGRFSQETVYIRDGQTVSPERQVSRRLTYYNDGSISDGYIETETVFDLGSNTGSSTHYYYTKNPVTAEPVIEKELVSHFHDVLESNGQYKRFEEPVVTTTNDYSGFFIAGYAGPSTVTINDPTSNLITTRHYSASGKLKDDQTVILVQTPGGSEYDLRVEANFYGYDANTGRLTSQRTIAQNNPKSFTEYDAFGRVSRSTQLNSDEGNYYTTINHYDAVGNMQLQDVYWSAKYDEINYGSVYSKTENKYQTVIDVANPNSIFTMLTRSERVEYTVRTNGNALIGAKTPKSTLSSYGSDGQLTEITRSGQTGSKVLYSKSIPAVLYTNPALGGKWPTAQQVIFEYDPDNDITTVTLRDGTQREVGVRVLQGYVEPNVTAMVTKTKASSLTVYDDFGASVKTVDGTSSQHGSVITRDAVGNITKQLVVFSDGHSETTYFEYDGSGQTVYEAFHSQAKGATTITGYTRASSYDVLGNQIGNVFKEYGTPVASFAEGNKPSTTTVSSFDKQGHLFRTTQDGVLTNIFTIDAKGNYRQTYTKDLLTGKSTEYWYDDNTNRTSVLSMESSVTNGIQHYTWTANIQLLNGKMVDEINALSERGYNQAEISNTNEEGQLLETYTLKGDDTTIHRKFKYSDGGSLASQDIIDEKVYGNYAGNMQTITYGSDGGIEEISHDVFRETQDIYIPYVRVKVVTFNKESGIADESLMNGTLQKAAAFSGPSFVSGTGSVRQLSETTTASAGAFVPTATERLIKTTTFVTAQPRPYPTSAITQIDLPYRLRTSNYFAVKEWDAWQKQVYLADEWPKITGIQFAAGMASFYRFSGSTTLAHAIDRNAWVAPTVAALTWGQMLTSMVQAFYNVGRRPNATKPIPISLEVSRMPVSGAEIIVKGSGYEAPQPPTYPGTGPASSAGYGGYTAAILTFSNLLGTASSAVSAYQLFDRYSTDLYGNDTSKFPQSANAVLGQGVVTSIITALSLIRAVAAGYASYRAFTNAPLNEPAQYYPARALAVTDIFLMAAIAINMVLKHVDTFTSDTYVDRPANANSRALALVDVFQDVLVILASLPYIIGNVRAGADAAAGGWGFNTVTGGLIPAAGAVLTTGSLHAQVNQLKDAGFFNDAKTSDLKNSLWGMTALEVVAQLALIGLASYFAPVAGAGAAIAGEAAGEAAVYVSWKTQILRLVAGLLPGVLMIGQERLIIDAVDEEINKPGFWPAPRFQQHLYRYGAMGLNVSNLDDSKAYAVSSPGFEESLTDPNQRFSFEDIAANWKFTDAEMELDLTALNLAQEVRFADGTKGSDLYSFKSAGVVHYLAGDSRATVIAGKRDNSISSEPNPSNVKYSDANYSDASLLKYIDVTIANNAAIKDSAGNTIRSDLMQVTKYSIRSDHGYWQADGSGTYIAKKSSSSSELLSTRDDLYGFTSIIGTTGVDSFELKNSSKRSDTWYIDGMGASTQRSNSSATDPRGDVFKIHAGFSNVQIVNQSEQSTLSLIADNASTMAKAVQGFWFQTKKSPMATAGTYDYQLTVVDVSQNSTGSEADSLYTIFNNGLSRQLDANYGFADSKQISVIDKSSKSYSLNGSINSLVSAMAAFAVNNGISDTSKITGIQVENFYSSLTGGINGYWTPT